jgi:hypothetical protein
VLKFVRWVSFRRFRRFEVLPAASLVTPEPLFGFDHFVCSIYVRLPPLGWKRFPILSPGRNILVVPHRATGQRPSASKSPRPSARSTPPPALPPVTLCLHLPPRATLYLRPVPSVLARVRSDRPLALYQIKVVCMWMLDVSTCIVVVVCIVCVYADTDCFLSFYIRWIAFSVIRY